MITANNIISLLHSTPPRWAELACFKPAAKTHTGTFKNYITYILGSSYIYSDFLFPSQSNHCLFILSLLYLWIFPPLLVLVICHPHRIISFLSEIVGGTYVVYRAGGTGVAGVLFSTLIFVRYINPIQIKGRGRFYCLQLPLGIAGRDGGNCLPRFWQIS